MKTSTWILLIATIIILTTVFYAGCQYGRLNVKCPEASSDTVYVTDTVVHNIPYDVHHYHQTLDTIIYYDTIFADVDTAAILKDYFAFHYYTRTWEDSLLRVDLRDWISENEIKDGSFEYQILRPQTIITNTINNYTYNKYLYLGLDVPLKDIRYVNIDLIFAAKKYYAGVGYNMKLNSFSAKGGFSLFKFK